MTTAVSTASTTLTFRFRIRRNPDRGTVREIFEMPPVTDTEIRGGSHGLFDTRHQRLPRQQPSGQISGFAGGGRPRWYRTFLNSLWVRVRVYKNS